MLKILFVLLLALVSCGCCCKKKMCGGDQVAGKPVASTPGFAVPALVLEGMRSPNATKAKVYLDSLGQIIKSAAYVSHDDLPDWVHKMADDKLGQGESTEFEIEHYPDGDVVYEVTRTVDGKVVEMSVKTDKTLKYIERYMVREEMPEAVRRAIPAGFTPEKTAIKEGPGLKQYILRGQHDGVPAHLVLDADGNTVGSFRVLPARIEVAR